MFRLPKGWSKPAQLDDFVLAAGLRIHRSGVVTTSPNGEEICGAAADPVRSAVPRAWYELAERICIVQAAETPRGRWKLFTADGDAAGSIADAFPRSTSPRRWMLSRSNGVALHTDWKIACSRAMWELAERDRVLRSWMGEIIPHPIALAKSPISKRRYEWLAFTFPLEERSFSEGLEVVGVFAFPRKAGSPLAMGFAARPDISLALAAATNEALQQLAFLWEAPRSRTRNIASPDFHLETFQLRRSQARLRAWFDGEHRAYARPRTRNRRRHAVRFVDLTGSWLDGRARVAKAICSEAVPLEFGKSPQTRHLPPELRIHPIA